MVRPSMINDIRIPKTTSVTGMLTRKFTAVVRRGVFCRERVRITAGSERLPLTTLGCSFLTLPVNQTDTMTSANLTSFARGLVRTDVADGTVGYLKAKAISRVPLNVPHVRMQPRD